MSGIVATTIAGCGSESRQVPHGGIDGPGTWPYAAQMHAEYRTSSRYCKAGAGHPTRYLPGGTSKFFVAHRSTSHRHLFAACTGGGNTHSCRTGHHRGMDHGRRTGTGCDGETTAGRLTTLTPHLYSRRPLCPDVESSGRIRCAVHEATISTDESR